MSEVIEEQQSIALVMRVPEEGDPYWDIFLSKEELAAKYPDDLGGRHEWK